MVESGWNIVRIATEWYFSNGYMWLLLLIAVIFIMIFNKNRYGTYLVWYTIFYAICILNPWSAVVLSKLGMDGVYWRIFWMLPVGCLIAYVFTEISTRIDKNIIKGSMVIVSTIIIVLSGKRIYTSDNFQLAENAYKIPNKVIEVCEYIEPGNAVLAPLDVMVWVRTYTADIYLPIGRQEYYFGGDQEKNRLVSQISGNDVLDVEYIASNAIYYGCKYIIVNKNQLTDGNWRDYGYVITGETDQYLIYKR